MIAEECKKLREQLEEVAKAEERESIVKQLETRRNDLLELCEAVLRETSSLNALKTRCELHGELNSTKCVERVQKVTGALKSDPLSITKGRDFSNMKKSFERFVEEAHAAAIETWQEYLPKARPTVDMNQLAQAESQEAFKSKAIQLRSRAKHADDIGKRPPATEEELANLEATWEDIRRMLSELPAPSDDPLIQEFLKAANSRVGASLDLLTEDVRKWLQDNSVADKYRITTI